MQEMFSHDELVDAMCASSVHYKSNIFKQNQRSFTRNCSGNVEKEQICARKLDLIDDYHFECPIDGPESTRFSTNINVLLYKIHCVPICKPNIDTEYKWFYVDMVIYESFLEYFLDDHIILQRPIDFENKESAEIELEQPILMKANRKYNICFTTIYNVYKPAHLNYDQLQYIYMNKNFSVEIKGGLVSTLVFAQL